MKASTIVGRTIVSVNQSAPPSHQYGTEHAVHSFTLDDGTVILFTAIEDPDGDMPYVTAQTTKRGT